MAFLFEFGWQAAFVSLLPVIADVVVQGIRGSPR
jgi:hypothetical protein